MLILSNHLFISSMFAKTLALAIALTFIFHFSISAQKRENLAKPKALVRKFGSDSLEKDLIKYLDTLQSYDEVISILKEKTALNKQTSTIYNRYIKKREHLKFTLDSIKLTIAGKYKTNDLTDKAETLFSDLTSSRYPAIRNQATKELGILLSEKKVKWHDEYLINPAKTILKPIGPLLLVLVTFFIVILIYNLFFRKEFLAVECNNEDEKKSFRLALKLMVEEINARNGQSNVLAPGIGNLLPFIEPDMPKVLDGLIAASVPDSYLKLISWAWQMGQNKNYIFQVYIEKVASEIFIKSRLIIKKKTINSWELKVDEADLFNTRMNMAYEAIIHIQIYR